MGILNAEIQNLLPPATMNQVQIPALQLNEDQFKSAVKAARARFSLIRKKHPGLKAHLVISLAGGQTGIGSAAREILKDFPALIVEDDAKARIKSFLKTPVSKDASDAEKKQFEQQSGELASELKYDGKCQVEIRFDALNYELVWQLQADELVDPALTPQTRASIRIVLGTLAGFAAEPQP